MALQVAPSDYAMFGGTAIAVKHALFDAEEAKLAVVSDLFGEDSFFADGDAFWSAQMAAIEACKAAYLEAGWPDVVVGHQHLFASVAPRNKPQLSQGRLAVKLRRDACRLEPLLQRPGFLRVAEESDRKQTHKVISAPWAKSARGGKGGECRRPGRVNFPSSKLPAPFPLLCCWSGLPVNLWDW